jgi:chromosome partitioning protein
MSKKAPKIVCVAQQKGGVCKTTSVLSLASAWALKGEKVLMLDTDPQANLTRNIIDYEKIKKDISSLYRGKISLKDLIMKTSYKNLFIVPTRTALSRVENLERTLSTFNCLKNNLPETAAGYSCVLIDTPPSLGLFTISALLAATHVLVPVQPTFFCQEGLGDLNESIVEARTNNASIKSVRYFITLFDKRTVINQELAGTLRKQLGDKVFKTVIRKNISIEESQYAQKTIYDYAPKSNGASDFRKLSEEVWEWLEKS